MSANHVEKGGGGVMSNCYHWLFITRGKPNKCVFVMVCSLWAWLLTPPHPNLGLGFQAIFYNLSVKARKWSKVDKNNKKYLFFIGYQHDWILICLLIIQFRMVSWMVRKKEKNGFELKENSSKFLKSSQVCKFHQRREPRRENAEIQKWKNRKYSV